jgi:itaconate CoA-transferase
LSVTGTPEQPSKAGCSIADIAAGMYAYSSILSALIQRGKTGKGSRIDVSMLESMVEWMGFPMYYAFEGASPPPRAGAAHATIYPYGPFATGDGKTVMLGLQNEREWSVFCATVMQHPELAVDERFASNSKRAAHRSELAALINGVFSALSAEQVMARLDQAQIANARMNSMADVWEHPQLSARQRWTEVGTSSGPIKALLPPGKSNAFEPRMDAVPALGEHTAAILAELGWAPEAVAQLRAAGAI